MSQPPNDDSPPAGQPPDQPTYGQPTYGQPTYGQPTYGQPSYGQPPTDPSRPPQYPDPPQYGQPQSTWSQPTAAQYGSDIRQTEAGYAQMYGQKPRTGMSVAALVLGIVGFLLCWVPVVGSILAILALVFGIVGLRRGAGKGMAVTGIVLGGLALVLSVLALIFVVRVGGDAVQIVNDCIDETGTDRGPAFEQCVNDKSESYNPFD